jgi:hypothetical protein
MILFLILSLFSELVAMDVTGLVAEGDLRNGERVARRGGVDPLVV